MRSFEILRPSDMHAHLRQDDMLRRVIIQQTQPYMYLLPMPNLKLNHRGVPMEYTSHPVMTVNDVLWYRDEISRAMKEASADDNRMEIIPENLLMTMYLTFGTNPDMIKSAARVIKALKFYPKGLTTNADWGPRSVRDDMVQDCLRTMEELGIVLCIHGEKPGFIMDREKLFLEDLVWIHKRFPGLKIVLEHVSTKVAIDCVLETIAHPNVTMSITAHHPSLTLNEVVGRNHHHCMPIPKRPEDREAIIRAMLAGLAHFGSDSAPHDISTKECAHACAGVFAPGMVAIAHLADIFLNNGRSSEDFERFVSINGPAFYDMKPVTQKIEIIREPLMVPKVINGVVPFRSGEEIPWRVNM